MLDSLPFTKEEFTPLVDTTKVSPRRSSPYVRKLNTYLKIPAFSLASTWRGSSEIIAKFNYSLTNNISFTKHFPISIPANVNYCACISWKPTSNTIVRYKLWQGAGEILYVPLYGNQRFTKDFAIEIWNTPTTPTAGPEIRFNTSKLILPTAYCDFSDVDITPAVRNCTDLTFHLNTYIPNENDYYLTISDCGEADLIKPPVLNGNSLLIQSTDGTWHVYSLLSFTDGEGNTFITDNVDQNNSAPGITPFIPLIFDGSIYSFALDAYNDPVYGLTHRPYLTGPISSILDYIGGYGKIVLPAGPNSYALQLKNINDNLSIFINQIPYVP